MARWLMNPTRIHEDVGPSLASIHGLRIQYCHELWCRLQTRLGSGVAVAVWHRPAATAAIRPLAWEPPYAMGGTLEKAKRPPLKKFLTLMLLFHFHCHHLVYTTTTSHLNY